MSVWLDHDRRAFHAGTYFPPTPTHGMLAFPQILAGISEAWINRRSEITTASTRINEALMQRESDMAALGSTQPTTELCTTAVSGITQLFDSVHAGFGSAPKFPPTMTLEFLLRYQEFSGDETPLMMVTRTCTAMARGGMYDQLAGGFARYSVDRAWVVPHFEKMLSDNALLARLYTHWYAASGDPLAKRIAAQTITFMIGDLTTDQGGFAAALDADSLPESGQTHVAVEGAAYVWTPEEFQETLGQDAEWAAALFQVTAAGTFEAGQSTLQLLADPDDWPRCESVRHRLLARRDLRPQPMRDDKVVAEWNALAITALARGAIIFDEPDWLAAAVRAGELLRDVHLVAGRLRRVSRDGQVGAAAGVLSDYGLTVEAFLTLQAATGDAQWFRLAESLCDTMIDQFSDGAAGFFDTAKDGEQLVRRPRDPADNATPAGASAAIHALVQMAALTGRSELRERAEASLSALSALQAEHPRFAGWSLAALVAALDGPPEVAIIADMQDPDARALLRGVWSASSTAVVAAGFDHEIPLLVDRPMRQDHPTAYVCRNFVCQAPVTDADALAALLG